MTAHNDPQPSVNERGIPIVLSASTRSPRRNLTPTKPFSPRRADPNIPGQHADESSQLHTPTRDKSIVDMHDSFSTALFNSHLKALSHAQGVSPVKRYPSQFTSPLRKSVVIKELPNEQQRRGDRSLVLENTSKHATPNPCTPSSQQQTVLMVTEDDIPEYHQQLDHTVNENKQSISTHPAENLDRHQDEDMKEHEPQELEIKADTAAKDSHQQQDGEPNDHTDTKEEDHQLQKRKRLSSGSKTAEEQLQEEVLEIMDEFDTLGNYYQLVDKIGEGERDDQNDRLHLSIVWIITISLSIRHI